MNFWRKLLVTTTVAALLPTLSTATADDVPVKCVQKNELEVCLLTVRVPAAEAGRSEKGSKKVTGGTQKCTRPGGSEVSCTSDAGSWHAGRMCYARPETPAPPLTDVAWQGHTDGVVMRCTSAGNVVSNYWQASAAEAAVPDPARLAQVAVSTMDLSPIQLGTFPRTTQEAPGDLGYVGWNVWMWAQSPDESTWGPITRSASEAGYTVTATARVATVVWDMGNGDSVTCDAGSPWLQSTSRNEPSPDCGYMYEHEGEYTITATSSWTVEWAGIGSSGTIELELSRSGEVRIAEVQVVNVVAGDG